MPSFGSSFGPGSWPSTLQETIQLMDSQLDRKALRQLCPVRANGLLSLIAHFHDLVENYRQSIGDTPELTMMIATGCRLSSDLSDAVLNRLVDRLQQREADLSLSHRAIRHQLQDQAHVSKLLSQVQTLRSDTSSLGEEAGLGMIL